MNPPDGDGTTLEDLPLFNQDKEVNPAAESSLVVESGQSAMLRVSSEVKQTEVLQKPKPVIDVETAGSQTVALAAMQDADDRFDGGVLRDDAVREGLMKSAVVEEPMNMVREESEETDMVKNGLDEPRSAEDDEASLMTAKPPGVEERHEREESGRSKVDKSDLKRLVLNMPSNREDNVGGQEEGEGSGKEKRKHLNFTEEEGGDVSKGSDRRKSDGAESQESPSSSKKEGPPMERKTSERTQKKRDLEKEAEELFMALPESVRRNVSHSEVEKKLDDAVKSPRGGSEKVDRQTGVMAKLVSDTGSDSGKDLGEKRPTHSRSESSHFRLPEKVNESMQYFSESAKEVLDYAPRPLMPIVALFYRLCRDGSVESLTWNQAGEEEVQELLHYAKLCMGAYSLTAEDAVKDSEHVVKVESVSKLVTTNSGGHCPAHIIYTDDERRDIVLAVRGLDMTSTDDFTILEDNSRGQQSHDDGYVHHGFYKAAEWLVENEGPFIKEIVQKHPDYRLVMVGHSLGAGIAMTFTMLITDNPEKVGGLRPEQIRCFGVAPPRCFSLGLSVKYAHVINSVVLQDDFLPRISTRTVAAIFPLAGKTNCFCRFIVNYACWSLCKRCLRDTFVSQKRLLQDPYRLYPPGRVYHVVHKHPCTCSCARAPTKVKTDIPVKSRFERAVLTGSTFFDHNLTALIKVLKEEMHVPEFRPVLQPPSVQKLERQGTMRREQGRALRQMQDVNTMRKDRLPPKAKHHAPKPATSGPKPAPRGPGLARQNSRRLFPKELELLGSGLGGGEEPSKMQGPFTRSILQRSMSTPHADRGDPPVGSTEAAAAAAVAKADGRNNQQGGDRPLMSHKSLDSIPSGRNRRSLSLVMEEPDVEGQDSFKEGKK